MVEIYDYNPAIQLTTTGAYRVDSISSYSIRLTRTSSTYKVNVNRSSDYYSKYQVQQRENKKKNKKQLQQERAELMRRQSLMVFNEVKPKILKPIGYPYKSVPKVRHQNYFRH